MLVWGRPVHLDTLLDGKPLRYLPAKRLLYSVGEDGVDDGGQEPNDLVVPVGPLIKVDKAGQR